VTIHDTQARSASEGPGSALALCLVHSHQRITPLILIALLFAGCEPAPSEPARVPKTTPPAPPRKVQPPAQPAPPAHRNETSTLPPTPSLAHLAAEAAASEFDLPPRDEGKIQAAGIRRLESRHCILYTDLPPAPGVEDLPQAFEAAIPLWCAYFGVEPDKVKDWKVIASVMKDRERFIGAGLYPERLPDFPHGYALGSQLFLYDQPSDYFRRHLLLHEGTHAFMLRWLNGAGPPWYMEGMAELLGTHRWAEGQLELGIMPASRDEVPYWGRVKIVKDAFKAGEPLSLSDILQFDAQAHVRVEAYGWCWAAAAFFDAHPKTQAAFRDLKSRVRDRSIEFSKQFHQAVKADWPAIVEDWQLFVAECDYGYDFARAAVVRKPATSLPTSGVKLTVEADRGWQSTGYRLEGGKTYVIEAAGRYQLKSDPPWPCEPGGVTIRFAHGHPLGMLMAGLSDLEGGPLGYSPLVKPQPIGLSAELSPEITGTLHLKVNEPANGLANNSGTLTVTIRAK
jgi:hypothetical protein